jgi:hypothetical protein
MQWGYIFGGGRETATRCRLRNKNVIWPVGLSNRRVVRQVKPSNLLAINMSKWRVWITFFVLRNDIPHKPLSVIFIWSAKSSPVRRHKICAL